MLKTPNVQLPRLTVEEFKNAEKTPLIIILDNVRSLNNVGSVFRTSDAFLLRGVCLCGITAKPPHRDIEKTALGSTENVYWEYFDSTIQAIAKLKALHYKIVGVEQTESSIYLQDFEVNRDEKLALIFGHEVMGVSDEALSMCDACIEIPQYGTKHSLNIAVSVGVVIWQLFQKTVL